MMAWHAESAATCGAKSRPSHIMPGSSTSGSLRWFVGLPVIEIKQHVYRKSREGPHMLEV